MSKTYLNIILGFALLISSARASTGVSESLGLSPFWNWKTLETEHFRLTFPAELQAVAEKSAGYFEEAHAVLKDLLYWEPRFRTQILVIDNTDLANGLTSAALRFGIVLMATPPDPALSIYYYDNWLRLLIFHEYTHLINMDPTTDWMEVLRVIFGDVIRPNTLWTNWMLEGLAVYMETRHTHAGRGRSPYYEMILRAAVDEKVLDTPKYLQLDRLHGPYPYAPGGEVPYLFGYHLMNQITRDKDNQSRLTTADGLNRISNSEDILGQMSYRSSHRVPFFINGNLENLTGKTWATTWSDWVNETRIRMNDQIAKISKTPVTPTSLITHGGGVLGAAISPDGKWLAYTQDSPDEKSGLYLRDLKSGKTKRIIDKLLGSGMSFTPDSKTLIFSSAERFHQYYLVFDLYAYSIDNDRVYSLTEGEHAKDPDISRDGDRIVYAHVRNQSVEIVQAHLIIQNKKVQLGDKRVLFTPEMYDQANNPKFSPSGQNVVFSFQKNGKRGVDLLAVDLRSNEVLPLVADGSFNRFPAFSSQGPLYYVSDKTGVDNLYRFDFEFGPLDLSSVQPTPMTNVITGLWLPLAYSSDKGETIYASQYSTEGWNLAEIDLSQTPMTPPSIDPPPAPAVFVPTDEEVKSAQQISVGKVRNYSLFPSILPRQWSPLFALAPGEAYLGGEIFGFDATDRHEYVGMAAYNTAIRKPDWYFKYTNKMFGPTFAINAEEMTSQIGYSDSRILYDIRRKQGDVSVLYPFRSTYSTLTPLLALHLEEQYLYLPPDPGYVAKTAFIPSLDSLLFYTNRDSSRLSIAPESGRDTRLGTRYYFDQSNSAIKGLFADTEYLKLKNHSVLMPSIAGSWTSKSSAGGLTNVNVEGRVPHLVDFVDGPWDKNLQRLGIRGYAHQSYSARAALVAALDFQFPISQIFRGIETYPVFFNQLYAISFLEDSILQNTPQGNNLNLASAGAGLRLSSQALIYIPLIFSLEYHQGLTPSQGGRGELFFTAYAVSLPL